MKPRMLAAYFEGEVTPSEGAAIEAELAESPRARRQLARLREIGEALAAPIPEIEKVDLVIPWKRAAAARSRSGWDGWPRIPGMLAVAAAIVAVTFAAVRRPEPDEFRAKSALGGNSRERWSGIRVYRVDSAGEATRLNDPLDSKGEARLNDRFRVTDGLLFSYTNLGPRPLDHLMVFGIDAGGQVRWFYPAYDQEGTNPESIAIKKGDADVPLPDVVHHDFTPGPLAIHAVFTDRALRVLDVEALARERRDPMAPLPLDGAVEHVVAEVVEP
jgi:hypothetical protein